jgi:hypothetical protein
MKNFVNRSESFDREKSFQIFICGHFLLTIPVIASPADPQGFTRISQRHFMSVLAASRPLWNRERRLFSAEIEKRSLSTTVSHLIRKSRDQDIAAA